MSTLVAQLVRYGYAPLLLIGINGAGIAVSAVGASKLWLIALLGVAVAVSFAAEYLLPYQDSWNGSHGDTGRDATHSVVNETLILASVGVIPALAACIPGDGFWPHTWPFLVQVLIAILVADLGITLAHYASHKIAVLWRFHAVHHSVTRFYGLNGLMKHPLHQTVEMTAGVTPLLLAGIPVPVAASLSLAVAVQLLLQHSNVDYRVGPFKYLLALNEGHRFHHLKWAGIGDVNFGLFTLIWDHLLRTYSYDSTRQFTSSDLGMAAKPDYPSGYLAQLAEPFTRDGACETAPATTDSNDAVRASTT